MLLSAAMLRAGMDVHMVTVHDGALDGPLAATGTQMHRVGSGLKRDPRVIPRLARLIRRVRPDVVNTWLPYMDIAAGAALRMARAPWVASERSVAEAYPPRFLYSARVALVRGANGIVANSEGGRDYWRPFIDERRLHVIPNIVPRDEIAAVPPAACAAIPDGAPVVLFVGRFSAEKNIERLLDALGTVMRQRPVWAVLCGDGPLKSAAEARARDLGIGDRVVFAGAVDNVWSWMKRATVLVAVSVFEGNPNAVLEAIAAGTPLVISGIGAHRAMLDETQAWFVDPASVESIAHGVLAAIDSPSESRSKTVRAEDAIASRSADEIARRYEEIYCGVVEGNA